MKNSLLDLNNHLFAQLERLGDEDLAGDKLKEEIERGRAVTQVSKQVVANASLVLRAEEFKQEYKGIGGSVVIPTMLSAEKQALGQK